MYLRQVIMNHHTERFLTKLGPYAHMPGAYVQLKSAGKNIQAGVVTEFAHLKGTRLALVTSLMASLFQTLFS